MEEQEKDGRRKAKTSSSMHSLWDWYIVDPWTTQGLKALTPAQLKISI